MDHIYTLPLWLQIYIQIENNPIIRGILRRTCHSLNHKNLLIEADFEMAIERQRIGWYMTNKDYELIADDSDEGNITYNFYDNMYKSTSSFLLTNERMV
jgi:hypothetical protein